ncbi:hypothetical protein AB1Y20_016064 [Prymnesium parvum]|uniref:Phospholipase B-like n=1 Tax=Prymnesium parvum TaxID=97485 RepID=A0AB34K2T9_PRYPA
MVQASTVAYKEGFDAAQAYLDKEGIPYTIDRLHSTQENLVLLGDGDVKIAYRGTDIKNVSDVSADALIAAGGEGIHPHFTNAEDQLRAVTDMYGKPSELLGYSLGGAKAMSMGSQFGIESTTFNPFLGKNLLTTPKTDAVHNIYRTTTDIASVGIGLANHDNEVINKAFGGKKNWRVYSIDPHVDAINPVESHELRNFTQVSERRPGATEQIMQRVVNQGTKTGELQLIHDMRIAQEQGNTFTDFVREFSPADADWALKGTRMTTDSKWVRLWEETMTSGGATSQPIFTQQEKYYFDNVGTSEKQLRIATREAQRKAFASMSEPERVAAIADEHVRMGEVVEAANAHTELHAASVSALKTALHPTNIGSGLAASYGTDMVMEHFVDPEHKIPEVPREAIEGAAAGVVTEGVGAALGTAASGAALGPVAAGGAVGSVVGAQTSKVIYKSMKDAGVDDTVSGVTAAAGGGAAGGAAMAATTSATAFAWGELAAAAGAGAVSGTEAGAVGGGGIFDEVTVPVGAAIGTVIGIASYLFGKL